MVTRRGFLRTLFGAIASTPVALQQASPAPSEAPLAPEVIVRKVYLDEVYVAGFRYHEGMRPEVLARLHVGDELALCPEPNNPHDDDAIAVHDSRGAHLGYVPRDSNGLPSRLAGQAVELGAEISALDPEAQPWLRLKIKLYQRMPEISAVERPPRR